MQICVHPVDMLITKKGIQMYLLIWLESGTKAFLLKRYTTIEDMIQGAKLLEDSGNEIVARTKILSAVDIAAIGMEVPVIKIEKL